MSDSTPAAQPNGQAASGPALPPLHKALEAVTRERHGGLRLRPGGFGFAAAANSIPLAAEEFVAAARTLPIVFTAQAPHLPVALTGLATGQNQHVDATGGWRQGVYIPSYLRRYPFFLLRVTQDSEELALCLDPTAPHLDRERGEPLFTAEGKAAPVLERAFAFTQAVEGAMLKTRTMSQGLAELGLLKAGAVQFQHHGRPMRVDGFFAVDRPALAALPADKLAVLRDRGWLEAIYAHLLSIGGLSALAGGQKA